MIRKLPPHARVASEFVENSAPVPLRDIGASARRAPICARTFLDGRVDSKSCGIWQAGCPPRPEARPSRGSSCLHSDGSCLRCARSCLRCERSCAHCDRSCVRCYRSCVRCDRPCVRCDRPCLHCDRACLLSAQAFPYSERPCLPSDLPHWKIGISGKGRRLASSLSVCPLSLRWRWCC